MSSPPDSVIGAVQGWCATRDHRDLTICHNFLSGNDHKTLSERDVDKVIHKFALPRNLTHVPQEAYRVTGLSAAQLIDCLENDGPHDHGPLCDDARRVQDVVKGAIGRSGAQSAESLHPDRITEAAHETAARTAAEMVISHTSDFNRTAQVVRVQDQIDARSEPDFDSSTPHRTVIPSASAESAEIASLYDRQDVSGLILRCSQQGVPLTQGLIQLARRQSSSAAALCRTENCPPRQFCLDIIEAAIDQDKEAYVGEILDICSSDGLDPARMKTKEEASVMKLVVSHLNEDDNRDPDHFCEVVRAKTTIHGWADQDQAMMVGNMLASIM